MQLKTHHVKKKQLSEYIWPTTLDKGNSLIRAINRSIDIFRVNFGVLYLQYVKISFCVCKPKAYLFPAF